MQLVIDHSPCPFWEFYLLHCLPLLIGSTSHFLLFCIARPLSPFPPTLQIRYAALDALCEVLIADRSQRLLERTGRRLDDFVHSLGGDKTTQLQQPSADAEAGAVAGPGCRE